MNARWLVVASLAAVAATIPPIALAQTPEQEPPRAVRRDIPITDMIRRALVARTRDSTGRPGREYWQLRVD